MLRLLRRQITLAFAVLCVGVVVAMPVQTEAQAPGTSDVQSAPPPAVLTWARADVSPLASTEPGGSLDDLLPFKRIAGSARVIGLGEPDHGIHEFLTVRNRLVEFLIQSMGITAIAAETGYSESVAVDDYITGHGELNPLVVGSVFSWSFNTPYAENRALLEWLRAYNARSSTRRTIHFYGLDLTGGRVGRFSDTHLAIDAALAYVAKVDTTQARVLHQRIDPLMPRFTSDAYDSLTAADQNALTAAIDDLVSLFDRRQVKWSELTSPDAYDGARHQAVIAQQLNANFRAASAESNPQAQREIAMAQNLRWILGHEGAGARIFLFAANWHISKGPMVTDRWGSSLGEHLQAMFGKEYVSIGTTFNRMEEGSSDGPANPVEGSASSLLSGLCPSQCLLDLRDARTDGPVAEWFRSARALRGGRNDSIVLSKAFDGLVYIAAVHPAG
jgi:erythromycin esterase